MPSPLDAFKDTITSSEHYDGSASLFPTVRPIALFLALFISLARTSSSMPKEVVLIDDLVSFLRLKKGLGVSPLSKMFPVSFFLHLFVSHFNQV